MDPIVPIIKVLIDVDNILVPLDDCCSKIKVRGIGVIALAKRILSVNEDSCSDEEEDGRDDGLHRGD